MLILKGSYNLLINNIMADLYNCFLEEFAVDTLYFITTFDHATINLLNYYFVLFAICLSCMKMYQSLLPQVSKTL